MGGDDFNFDAKAARQRFLDYWISLGGDPDLFAERVVSDEARDQFVAAYQRLIVPSLVKQCKIAGTYIALGETTFGDAFGSIVTDAIRHGLSYLPRETQDYLQDQLLTRLTEETELARELVSAARKALGL